MSFFVSKEKEKVLNVLTFNIQDFQTFKESKSYFINNENKAISILWEIIVYFWSTINAYSLLSRE